MDKYNTIKEQMEAYVDSESLTGLLAALIEICHEKAEHIAVNWQDRELSSVWTRVGRRLSSIETEAL